MYPQGEKRSQNIEQAERKIRRKKKGTKRKYSIQNPLDTKRGRKHRKRKKPKNLERQIYTPPSDLTISIKAAPPIQPVHFFSSYTSSAPTHAGVSNVTSHSRERLEMRSEKAGRVQTSPAMGAAKQICIWSKHRDCIMAAIELKVLFIVESPALASPRQVAFPCCLACCTGADQTPSTCHSS